MAQKPRPVQASFYDTALDKSAAIAASFSISHAATLHISLQSVQWFFVSDSYEAVKLLEVRFLLSGCVIVTTKLAL